MAEFISVGNNGENYCFLTEGGTLRRNDLARFFPQATGLEYSTVEQVKNVKIVDEKFVELCCSITYKLKGIYIISFTIQYLYI